MSAAGRALRILEYLAASAQPISSRELAETLGIPRSTLSDLLAELRALGYVNQVGTRHVSGTALTLLGYRVTRRLGTPGAIEHSLAQLAQATGETAIYCVEIGGDGERPGHVLIVEQVASPNPIRYVAPAGEPRPMAETASGRVLLAFSPRALDADAPLTEALERVRQEGYEINAAASGATSIAVPLRDDDGRVVAALAVTGPSARMTDAAERILPTLRAAAERLHGG